MATVASINVALNAQTGQFNAAMNGASKTTAQFQAQASSGSGKIGQQIQAAGFAFQDFTSVLQNGGKGALGRAFGSISNNIGQITAGFGPWGAVIGTVAGALAGVLIPKLLETGNAVDEVREKFEEAFNKDLKLRIDGQGFSRRLSKMDSKEAFSESEDLAAQALDLRTELDAKRKQFEAELGGLVGRGGIVTAFGAPENANPILRRNAANGTNIDFNQSEFSIQSQEAADLINKRREELFELDKKVTQTKDKMKEAFAAGRRQEDLEGIQKHLAAWNEFNDAIKHHEDLLERLDINSREDLEQRVFSRIQSESAVSRAATGAASFGSTESYSAIAAASRQNSKSDIQASIEVEKRIEAETKKVRKKIEDLIAKQPVVVSAN